MNASSSPATAPTWWDDFATAGVESNTFSSRVGEGTLYIENITVSFDGFRALNELTLYIERGELRCIIGPNGAGKSTMMDVITGKTRPDRGRAWFGPRLNLLKIERTGNCRGRYRSQVSKADGV